MRRGSVEIEGRRLETAAWGPSPAAAPTIVLLHEGLGCISLWKGFPEMLATATGCCVFAWSRLGYGASDPAMPPRPLDYMQQEATRFVRPVLDAAGIGDCILLGHSDGGSIAALYAGTQHDARVRGLALLAPHFFVEDLSIAGIELARERYLTGDFRARLARHPFMCSEVSGSSGYEHRHRGRACGQIPGGRVGGPGRGGSPAPN